MTENSFENISMEARIEGNKITTITLPFLTFASIISLVNQQSEELELQLEVINQLKEKVALLECLLELYKIQIEVEEGNDSKFEE